MTATTLVVEQTTINIRVADVSILDSYVIEDRKGIFWNGHQFEVLPLDPWQIHDGLANTNVGYTKQPQEYTMVFYYPIDQRTIESDWAGAIKAKPNADGTAWLPDWDVDFMIDHEYKMLAAVDTSFDYMERTIPAIRARHLMDFKENVKEAVLVELRSYHLGYYHQNPHAAHIHEPLERGIAATVAKWTEEAPARTDEYNIIKPYISRYQTCLLYTSPSPRDS